MSKGKKRSSSAAVAAALLTHRAAITDAGRELFASVAKDGQAPPDLGLVAELCARRMEAASSSLPAEDIGTEGRQKAARDLRGALTDLHGLVSPTLFGKRWAERLKLPEVLPEEPEVLAIVGRDIARALKKKKHSKPGVKGMLPIDRAAWLDRIKTPLEVLEGKRNKERPSRSRRPSAPEAALASALLALAGADAAGRKKTRAKKAKKRAEEAPSAEATAAS